VFRIPSWDLPVPEVRVTVGIGEKDGDSSWP
jgi:hypothetical protein